MGYRAKPVHGLRRRMSGGLLIAALIAALLAFVPGAPATAGEVSKQGTLGDGYFFVATDGGIFNFGDSDFFGSTGDIPLNKPIVGAASTPTGEGYWLVASDGGIFTFGDAQFLGSEGGGPLNSPIVAMAATPTGKGYWLFAADGGVFTHGDAEFFGSQGATPLNKPIVGADATASGKGYYLVASDGGIFTHGDAEFFGSQGGSPLNKPIVGMAATDDGKGYYLVASDGGIFTHGKTVNDAPFFGSQGGSPLNKPIVGMALTASNQGYYLVAADGGIFSHGDAVFYGSTGNLTLNKPIVGMAVTPNSPIAAPDFVARLSGAKETDAAGGDTDASGFANIDLTDDELCYNIKVNSLDTPATAAHIHKGPAGVAGPVVATLKTPDANGTSSACQEISKDLSAAILANPQGYYVNVHNAGFPNGAARGQLKGHTGVALAAPDAGSTLAKIVVFDTENPGSASVIRTFDTQGAAILGADFRPGTTDAYILLQTAGTQATLVKSTLAGVTTTIGTVTIAGPAAGWGVDFNPLVDRIRVVNTNDENSRVNPDTAAEDQDTALSFAAGDVNAGANPNVSGAAYTNNFVGAESTVLYDIDTTLDALLIQTPPNAGTLTTVGALGVDLSVNNGFDISRAPAGELGTTLVAGTLTGGTGSVLLAVNRTNGDATNIGAIGTDTTLSIRAFSILPL